MCGQTMTLCDIEPYFLLGSGGQFVFFFCLFCFVFFFFLGGGGVQNVSDVNTSNN